MPEKLQEKNILRKLAEPIQRKIRSAGLTEEDVYKDTSKLIEKRRKRNNDEGTSSD